MLINEYLFREKLKLDHMQFIDSGTKYTDNDKHNMDILQSNSDEDLKITKERAWEIAALLKYLEHYGYTLSNTIINDLSKSFYNIKKIHKFLDEEIKRKSGAKYKPMWENFPEDVLTMQESQLYYTQYMSYLATYFLNAKLEITQEIKTRFPLIGNYKPKVIEYASFADYIDSMKNLLKSSLSLNDNQKHYVKDYLLSTTHMPFNGNELNELFESMVNKDTKLFVINEFLKAERYENRTFNELRSPTDILKLYTYMSDGDTTLIENTKFVNIKRPIIRKFLNRLEVLLEVSYEKHMNDMLNHRNRWKRINEKWHVRRYKQFRNVNKVFDCVYNSMKFVTNNTLYEMNLEKGEYLDAARILSEKPTELARHIVNLTINNGSCLDVFKGVIGDVSTKCLLDLYTRCTYIDNNTYFIRGCEKIFVKRNKDMLNWGGIFGVAGILERIQIACENELKTRFQEKEGFGKVYFDPALEGVYVPFSNSTQRANLPRGSRFKIPEDKNVVRGFVYWKNTDTERVDIDLSASFLDEDFKLIESCAYYNQRSGEYTAMSGDITNAPSGAAEYVDIDIAKLKETEQYKDKRYRYVVITNKVYTGQSFRFIHENGGEAYCGFMLRNDLKSGEIFEPKTVKEKVILESNSNNNISVIIDMKTMEYIWVDYSGRGNFPGINASNSRLNDSEVAASFANLKKLKLFDLVKLNVEGQKKSIFTEDREEADICFGLEEGDIKPTDVDYILGNLM